MWGLEVPSERVQPREGGEDSIIEGLILLYFVFLWFICIVCASLGLL